MKKQNDDSKPTEKPYDPVIASEKVRTESKRIFIDLKENDRGLYLRIKESHQTGKTSMVLIPVEAFDEFADSINRLVEYSKKL